MNNFKRIFISHRKKMFFVIISVPVVIFIMIFLYNNFYRPVRLSDPSKRKPSGFIYSDENNLIKSYSSFFLKNHSTTDQKVTFVVYQSDVFIEEAVLFDIDSVEFVDECDAFIKEQILSIPAGESVCVVVIATAKDSTIAKPTRSGANVKIVRID